MPPRKSDPPPPRKSYTDDTTPADESQPSTRDKDAITIEDVALPKSIIARLAKGVLPPNTQIQANAIIAMSKSVTVFINYLASHANEHTMHANKKTISPADVFKALDDVEFSFLKEPLEAEFAKFNQIQTEKRTNYRQKVKTKPDGDDAEMADATIPSERDADADADAAGPRTKKARVDDDAVEEDDDAETEEEGDVQEDDEDDEDEGEEEGEEEDHDGDGDAVQASGDEAQDALEERVAREEGDEALDGDESD